MKEHAKSNNPKLSLSDIKTVVPTVVNMDQQGKVFGFETSTVITDAQLTEVCWRFGLSFDIGLIYDDNHACYTFHFV